MNRKPGKIAGPGEWQEGNCCHVVDKHLNKIFSFNISELGNRQRPVEWELDHVIPPDGALYVMVWVIVPKTILNAYTQVTRGKLEK